ncbi:MAG: hypothetical protein ACI841_000772 [Planctomycetota bacterium]|jgi:hypothetical protein
MSAFRSTALAAGLLPLLIAGCSSSGNEAGPDGGVLYIEACSLGCTGGNDGAAVSCTIVNTFRNQEIAVLFSAPVEQSTVNASSFRVVDVSNGTTPIGEFFVDVLNPRRLVFRPELTFGVDGVPNFGFEPFTTYEVTIPGEAQGDAGPFIRSTKGRNNQSRLQCTIFTDQGVIDPVPGTPRVTMFVETENDESPVTPIRSAEVVSGEVRVKSRSEIRMVFDDIMNVATMLDPSTGNSTTVTVEVDADGQLGSSDDRDDVAGSFDVEVNLESLQTILTFRHEVRVENEAAPQPTAGFPSAGDGLQKRRIVVEIRNAVVDLINNSVSEIDGGGANSFVPESTDFTALILPGMVDDSGDPFGEDGGAEDFTFSNSPFALGNSEDGEFSSEDAVRSSAIWGDGQLKAGVGGGSGRLGDLYIPGGETVTLNTESQVFPLGIQNDIPDLIGNEVYSGGDPTGNYLVSITIEDGVFEFNSVIVETGGTLIFEGANAARLFSRGRMNIQNGALIDISGSTAAAHDSAHADPTIDWTGDGAASLFYATANFLSETAAGGGPGAGSGGLGGTRYNTDSTVSLFIDTGFLKGAAFRAGWALADMDGNAGEGIGGEATPLSGQGTGGDHWPTTFPDGSFAWIAAATNTKDVNWNEAPNIGLPAGTSGCFSRQVGGTGAGGGFGTNGSGGNALSDLPVATDSPAGDTDLNNLPGTTEGGQVPFLIAGESVSFTNAGYSRRTLAASSASSGFLVGGSGGGGGGNHPYGTYSNGLQHSSGECGAEGTFVRIWPDNFSGPFPGWLDHSGAAGGGGGGAIQLCSGALISIDGVIDASGGNGGSAVTFPSLAFAGGLNASPGGGGSGGAVRIQSRTVTLADQPGRVNVSGGQGGVSSDTWGGSLGGDGGAGLVRIETQFNGPTDPDGANHDEYDHSIAPYDEDGIEFGPFSVDFLSVDKGFWVPGDSGAIRYHPETYSGSTSCWIQPQGNFFTLNFTEDPDPATNPTAEEMGWNMHIRYMFNGDIIEIPYRGPGGIDSPVGDQSLEEYWGNCLNHGNEAELGGNCLGGDGAVGSPITVRFQGARVATVPGDLCTLGTDTPIDPTSLTPWVKHPSELNPNLALGRDWPQPNLIRYTIIFDEGANLDGGLIRWEDIDGVDNIWIRSNPD